MLTIQLDFVFIVVPTISDPMAHLVIMKPTPASIDALQAVMGTGKQQTGIVLKSVRLAPMLMT